MKKQPVTQKGYDMLCEELNDLNKVQRPATVIELDIARSHGDLKENAEYHAAKEKLAFIDNRLADLSNITLNSQIIDPSSYDHDSVKFGSTIELEDLDTEELITYTIVGVSQSDPELNRISINTPLASALMNKKEGADLELKLPSGNKEYEIIKIYYKEF
ncbi:MAG: Transcription elongation factor GreA [uncultured Campylobacterales bacterium]|uniref:Transcription elongation factor GreA n=1 Tax=uncultured Campylobacterales bacterium TaxID=352960 RepID=A0A6S6T8L8_9BACT|nr:MAG: Transcription elongation factor GreA [uncultured Campylobacterales bacterium]